MKATWFRPSAIQTIERALMFAARDPFGGGFGDIRETGIQLRGSLGGQFDYRLGLFNGLGERQNQSASSDTKAVIARLVYRPRGIDGLQLGISGATGNTRNATAQVGGVPQRADREVLNALRGLQKDKFTVQTEFMTADSQRLAAVSPSFDRDIRSYYGSVGYLFTPKLEGVLRYDYLDLDRNAPAGVTTQPCAT
jgi:hypothetical protein